MTPQHSLLLVFLCLILLFSIPYSGKLNLNIHLFQSIAENFHDTRGHHEELHMSRQNPAPTLWDSAAITLHK